MESYILQSEKLSTGISLLLEENALHNQMEENYTILFRYTGDFQRIQLLLSGRAIALLNQFAVGIATKETILELVELPEILYIDITRQMEYEQALSPTERIAACFPVRSENQILSGTGICIGVIDSGIDIFHPAFLRNDQTNRVISYWNQSGEGNPPAHYRFGTEYLSSDLQTLTDTSASAELRFFDRSGHGTGVASILAALSPDADLIGVSTLPNTAAFLCGIDYAVRTASALEKPLVLNLSYGNNYGDHQGNSLTENYLDALRENGKITIVTGMGNEGNTSRHCSIHTNAPSNIGIFLGNGLRTCNLQLWSTYEHSFRFRLIAPNGMKSSLFSSEQEGYFFEEVISNTQLHIQIGQPTPYNPNQEILISFSGSNLSSGSWQLEFYPIFSAEYQIHAWLPVAASTTAVVEFEQPSTMLTLTIPASAQNVISVGAYDSRLFTIPPFSGQGNTQIQKPDLVAPGVSIRVAVPGGGYIQRSGTSFSVPFVASAAANLMQWGITDGNDPFLYGERLKAYLRNGASPLPGNTKIPNPAEGWGRLCAAASFP